MRWSILPFLMINSLLADGIPDKALGAIHTEALWFVGVIAVMAVISFVVSSRNAKKYAEKMAREKREEESGKSEEARGKSEAERKKRKEVTEKSKGDESDSSVDRLLELSKLHKEGLLSKEEFLTFKTELYRELKEIHVGS